MQDAESREITVELLAEKSLQHLQETYRPVPLVPLRDLLTQLEAIYAQGTILSIMRVQKSSHSGNYESALTNALWRTVRARGHELINNFHRTAHRLFTEHESPEADDISQEDQR